jgi:ubiquinone/menaquinone biosynthesis C-methylase UbiE
MTRAHPEPRGVFSRIYDPVIEPVERLGLGGLRRETLRGLSGPVLELGVGTGRSFGAYPDEVSAITGIDPDESMLARAGERAREAGVPVRLAAAPAENLPFPDGTFDAVAAFLTLCTVRDPAAALGEARRVLVPGGSLRLLEHVRVDREPIARLQETLTPAWKKVAGGCHLDRRTLEEVYRAGFVVERVERYLGGLVIRVEARRVA